MTRTDFLDYETGEEGYFPMSGFIGGWLLVAIVAASMSTGDGAILAMGTVWSHNVLRRVKSLVPEGTGDAGLLKIARISSFFFAAIAAVIASSKPDKTGYFLIVAFVSRMYHTHTHTHTLVAMCTSAATKGSIPTRVPLPTRSLTSSQRMRVRIASSLGGLCRFSPLSTGPQTW